MKVPPLQNSIVCAIPSQTIVRQSVLAAVSVLSVLCGAASAQSAPAAPPLTLFSAVEVSHSTKLNRTYSLEHSTDLGSWTVIADPVFGDSEVASHLIPGSAGSGFYRLKVESYPVAGKSRWSLAGSRMVLNTARGNRHVAFEQPRAGSMTTATGVTTFTWDWQRDGLDSGVTTLISPDGSVETLTMQFTGLNAGVYSSQRSVNGLPAGTAAGTFRDEADPSLAVSVPAILGDSLITISGTGRAVGVKVRADGTAGISSPAGGATYDCNYAVTGPATAELMMTCSNGARQSWSLTFTGPACGNCTWQTSLNGVLRRESSGSFTIAPL